MKVVAESEQMILENWLNTTFRKAIENDALIMEHALYILKVGTERGDCAVEVMRRVITSFVIEVINPDELSSGR